MATTTATCKNPPCENNGHPRAFGYCSLNCQGQHRIAERKAREAIERAERDAKDSRTVPSTTLALELGKLLNAAPGLLTKKEWARLAYEAFNKAVE